MTAFGTGASVAALGSGSYTLRVTPTRTYLNGRVQPASPSDVTISASVQPAGHEEVRDEGGNYASDAVLIWSLTPVLPSRDGFEADQIIVGGKVYEVSLARDWSAYDGHYYAEAIFRVAAP